MSTDQTNSDKIFKAVINDEQLIKFYHYNPDDFSSISDAYDTDNAVIQAIAKIINRNEENATEKEIYNEVSNYLKSSI